MGNTLWGATWDSPEPYNWEETEPVHTFEDGWTIVPVRTTHDRTLEARLFDGMACINGGEWTEWLESGHKVLLSLRNPEGKPHATILLGDAEWTIKARAGFDYAPYAHCKQGDQTPRCLDGKPVISLQFCPRGHMAGDPGERHELTPRLTAWFTSLPVAEEYEGYRCSEYTREDAKKFLKERQLDGV